MTALLFKCAVSGKTLRTPFSLTLVRLKQLVDESRVPVLNNEDLEEEFVRGSGPGGQAVARTSNAVNLKHKPTGFLVKCHQTRSLERNRELARELLIIKLDNHFNGDMSVEAQKERIAQKRSKNSLRKSQKINDLKLAWKEREGL